MKHMKSLLSTALVVAALASMSISAQAADYSFQTDGTPEYYASTSYEGIYSSQYNYGGINLIDYQIPELAYGSFSTTQTGIMEKALLPGLQASVAVSGGSSYGISDGGISILPVTTGSTAAFVYQQTAYTSVEGMELQDGSIGTVKIPSLGISMKVWEGETTTSMSKGLGHYSSTSAWDGNVGVCGHNRGAKYVIGSIKDLEAGDIITYTTIYGTRTYQVVTAKIISNTDWSYLQATTDNRITLTTCLADHPESRVCVQAVEVNG